MTTLSDGATTVTLPDTLIWTDEFSWVGVEQHIERTLTGALIVSASELTGGRPITLASTTDDRAWVSRSVVLQCQSWAAVANKQLTLSLRGVARTVVFRQYETALEAAPVLAFDDVNGDDDYRVTLRMMEI
jgi:hypothetical protein